jgi:hypothetical protein
MVLVMMDILYMVHGIHLVFLLLHAGQQEITVQQQPPQDVVAVEELAPWLIHLIRVKVQQHQELVVVLHLMSQYQLTAAIVLQLSMVFITKITSTIPLVMLKEGNI